MTGSFLDRLPPHERRRLSGLPGAEVLAERRVRGEPLQYLEGTAAFTDFDVAVDRRVLIPRPETEGLFELVAGLVDAPGRCVDLGTGSGVLALALARRFPDSEVHAVDLSPCALELARSNAASLGVEVVFHLGDLFDALPGSLAGSFDVIVSNPPYVTEAEWPELPPDVRCEPRMALVAGPAGTEVLARIAAEAARWLRPDGVLACEIGEQQGLAALEMLADLGRAEVHSDLAGRPRYVVARRRP